MTNKKDLIIAVLATFCLASAFFMVLPSKSAGEYDAWRDINDDGKIDMKDIGYTVQSFGTAGDPTKNVIVTGRANKLAYSIENHTIIEGDIWQTPYLSVDGYSKIVLIIQCGGDAEYVATCRHRGASHSFVLDTMGGLLPSTIIKVYDVPNQEVSFTYLNMELHSVKLWADVYLIV